MPSNVLLLTDDLRSDAAKRARELAREHGASLQVVYLTSSVRTSVPTQLFRAIRGRAKERIKQFTTLARETGVRSISVTLGTGDRYCLADRALKMYDPDVVVLDRPSDSSVIIHRRTDSSGSDIC